MSAAIKRELRHAVRQLSERGLYHSAKWAAELMTQIDVDEQNESADLDASDMDSHVGHRALFEPEPTEDLVVFAKTYFDLKEYARAAHALTHATSKEALFLRGYALFMAGEKRKEEEWAEKTDPLARAQVVNRELAALNSTFQQLYEQHQLDGDGFCLYLYGLVLKEQDHTTSAIQVLIESVNAYPWNWSAWKALSSLCDERDTVVEMLSSRLVPHWMCEFFQADVLLELHQHEHLEVLNMLDALAEKFPHSTYVLAQTALAHYNMREFDEAQELLEELLEVDEYRLTNMDTYSNILYVKEAKGALSYLAHNAVLNDKYRPETCCIVGNYYSLKGKHEKAVLYFKRALKLNPHYLAAWTLMGHEYVEMRNTSAAIEAYRRAVDINSKDYRAWYGLGQTYEILQMHTYSLYYFRKATTLRPYDPRMWCAMAACYEHLNRIEDAIKCYLRAEGNEDREGIALNKLAKLYASLGDYATAAHYYERVIARRAHEEVERQETIDALLFLADYRTQQGEWATAEQLCSRLLDIGGPAKDHAKSLLLRIRRAAASSTSSSAAAAAAAGQSSASASTFSFAASVNNASMQS